MLFLIQREVDKLAVASLLFSFLKHLRGKINTTYILEPCFFEVLTNKAGATSEIKNLCKMFLNHMLGSDLGDEFLHFLWVWVPSSQIGCFVVLSDVVEMRNGLVLLVLVVLFHFFDALCVNVDRAEIEDLVHL